MKKKECSKGFVKLTVLILAIVGLFAYFAMAARPVEVKSKIYIENTEAVPEIVPEEKVKHIKTPDAVKSLYMTSWVAGSPSIRSHVIDLIDTTEANAIVIDIKDDTGMISFIPNDPKLLDLGNYENRISDVKEFIEMLHDKGIYVIGRVAVFQDPALTKDWPDQAVQNANTGAVWEDRKGISWMDAGSRKVWDYSISIANEAYSQGFDEINFDYVRFPTDGNLGNMKFPITGEGIKADTIEKFFTYLDENIRNKEDRMVISADLFGMTTTAQDDLGIGQVLDKVVPHVDFVGPMVYPSHYPDGFEGFADPNLHVYDVIHIAMTGAKNKLEKKQDSLIKELTKRTNAETGEVYYIEETNKEVASKVQKIRSDYAFSKIRPWLQDFDYGGNYGVKEVRDQMQAAYDTGLKSWMIWDPSNKYTPGAYLAE